MGAEEERQEPFYTPLGTAKGNHEGRALGAIPPRAFLPLLL